MKQRRFGASVRVVAMGVVAAIASAFLVGVAAGSAAEKSGGTRDPKGIFRFPSDTTAVHWDLTKSTNSGQMWNIVMWVYEPLMRGRLDGPPEPGLATKVEIVDPSTIDITLRQGAKFTDGAPVNAEAVKTSLDRTLAAAKAPGALPGIRPDMKLIASTEVTGPNGVRVRLAEPKATVVYPLITGVEGVVYSPTALANPDINLDTTPVGAGPFKLDGQYVPGQTIKLAKNPDYWDAKNVKWGSMEIPNITVAGTAGSAPMLNALQAKQISYATFQSSEDIGSLEAANQTFELVASPSSTAWSNMCMNKAPLDNVKVRQAMQHATDREELNRLFASGRAEVAWSLYPKSDEVRHVASLDNRYPHNPKKARKLLTQAGFPNGVDVEIIPIPGSNQIAEILQQQWKEAGINLIIKTSANPVQELLIDNKANMGTVTVARAGVERLTQVYRSASINNLCTFQDPKLNTLIDEVIAATPGTPEEKQAYAKAQEYILDNALDLWYLFLPVAVAWDDSTVGGVTDDTAVVTPAPGPPIPNFRVIFTKKEA